MRYDEVEGLPPGQFKRLTGVRRETFEQMLSVLSTSEQRKKRPGRPSKHGIHEANTNRIIRKVEGALTVSGAFKLPGKRAARSDEGVELLFVVVDATETPVERPKKQRRCYSGKRKRHTLKAQVLLNWETQHIIATAFGKGRTHDFKFKHSHTHLHPHTMVLADLATWA